MSGTGVARRPDAEVAARAAPRDGALPSLGAVSSKHAGITRRGAAATRALVRGALRGQTRAMSEHALAAVWRRIIRGETKSWVAFAHGTVVILPAPGPDADLAAAATEILRAWGPVHVGTPAGDVGTITLEPGPGWVVYGHHPDMLTYVGPEEVTSEHDLVIAMHGRGKRDADARALQVVHVEDARGR